jgi:hypothetical protein
VDGELELLKRSFRSAPDDVPLAIRMAGALERSGRVEDAWTELASFLARASNKGRAQSLRAALAEIAQRHPALAVAQLCAARPPRAKLLAEALANEGAVAPLVVLALEQGSALRELAERNLARTLAPAYPGLSSVDETERVLAERVDWYEVDGQLYGPSWRARRLARRLEKPVEQAVEKRLVAFLPWLHVIRRVGFAPLAAAARDAFITLSGVAAPPLDVGLLAS